MHIGNLYGPDATFLGVPAADPDVPAEWSTSGAAIIGAPFDGGRRTDPVAASVPKRFASRIICRTTGCGRASPSGSTR